MEDKIEIKKKFKNAIASIHEIFKNEDLEIELKELYNTNSLKFIEKSICYVFYNEHTYFNNTYKIDIDIEDNTNKRLGSYVLYLDENENFVDEFFIIN
ncbi:hypothetical protein [Chryseobacterium aureum]|uniref:hypothetical protein n=1 Tax=Chryseobacterium aureum TaxID=2497456 RepID=UPI000F86DAA3|nr:hypothetical protein [Chryseobacterium aureum]